MIYLIFYYNMTDVHIWLRGASLKYMKVLVISNILPFHVDFIDLFCVMQAVTI